MGVVAAKTLLKEAADDLAALIGQVGREEGEHARVAERYLRAIERSVKEAQQQLEESEEPSNGLDTTGRGKENGES